MRLPHVGTPTGRQFDYMAIAIPAIFYGETARSLSILMTPETAQRCKIYGCFLNGSRADQLAQLDTLAEGYREFRDFPADQLQLIEPLRGLRMVHYMAWLAKRWQDPAFPRAFPWFADAKYWEGQVLAFKEQLAALEAPPLTLYP